MHSVWLCNTPRKLFEETFNDPYSGKVFQMKPMFFCYLHLKPVHIKEKPFKCNQWNYKSVLFSSLQTHQRVHSGKKSYQCNQCNSLFAHDDTLKKHLRMHSGLKPYKCNQCNKRSLVKKAHDPSHQCRTKEAQMYPVWILYKPSFKSFKS